MPKRHSEKTKKKISRSMKGRVPWNKGLKGWNNGHVGVKHTEETKRKIGKKSKGNKYCLGRILSNKTKEKISNSRKGKNIGKNNPGWKGGISKNKKMYRRRRRNLKNKTEGSHTSGEWKLLKKQYGYKCPACKKKEPYIILTEDHIIPLSKGGSDYIENIQPLCKICNCKKYTKIIKFNKFNK